MSIASDERGSTGSTRRAHDHASSELAQLSAIDHQLLEVVSRLRVVTQTQLDRLHADVPDRTLRYRTRRLHRLGYLGRTRPYRDHGSAPHHLWPTNKGDALVRALPPPRRGERREPSPLFLAHTAAVSELYVILRTHGEEAGMSLVEFRREGEARQPFRDAEGCDRAVAPDAMIALRDHAGRLLLAHVEMDLGTMTHARLRRKLDGYLAHTQSGAPVGGTPLVPALLFITTSGLRAEAFMRAAREMRARPSWRGRAEALTIAACARAHRLDEVLTDPCWSQATSDARSTLGAVLHG